MEYANKIPAVTLGFWAIKIAATTLGETGGDAVSMSMNLGYALSSAIFFVVFLAVVSAQIRAHHYKPFLYWSVIVATTTVGTTMADFADRSIGIGYLGGSLVLLVLLSATLVAWWLSFGTISVSSVNSPKVETFYWFAILFSNTLGTALGDFTADESGLGFGGAASVFAVILALLAAAYWFTDISRTLLFWAAFIFTRPFGATLGDVLTKPIDQGGLDLSRFASSAALLVAMIVLIALASRQNQERDDTTGRASSL